MSQRILVVDDDPQIVRLIRSYLEQSAYQVQTAADGESALQMLRSSRPDLMILDVMLPGRDGWQIIHAVRNDAQLASLPIIMLTARIEDTDRIVGLEMGADDYMTKPFNPREVLARVRAVLRRTASTAARSHILQCGGLRLDSDRHTVTVDGQAVEVTPTEFALLHVFMQHPGHVFTRLALIERGLGYHAEGMERTIDSHIKNLRKKIEPDPANPTYIQTVYGVGYRLQE